MADIVAPMPNWLRSVVSIVVGFVVFYALQGVCSFAATRLFNLSFDQPTAKYLAVALLYTFVSALVGGYVAARIARHAPVAHGIGVALLMLPLMLLNFRKGFGGQETWFVLARSVATPLFAIFGAAIDKGRHAKHFLN